MELAARAIFEHFPLCWHLLQVLHITLSASVFLPEHGGSVLMSHKRDEVGGAVMMDGNGRCQASPIVCGAKDRYCGARCWCSMPRAGSRLLVAARCSCLSVAPVQRCLTSGRKLVCSDDRNGSVQLARGRRLVAIVMFAASAAAVGAVADVAAGVVKCAVMAAAGIIDTG
jgi:hypothetical protein